MAIPIVFPKLDPGDIPLGTAAADAPVGTKLLGDGYDRNFALVNPELTTLLNRVAALEAKWDKTPYVKYTTGFVAGPNWTITGADIVGYAMLFPRIATLQLDFIRTGATVTANSAGLLVDEVVCTLPVALRPAFNVYGMYRSAGSGTGETSGGVSIAPDGTVRVRDCHANGFLKQGENVRISMSYPLPPVP